MENFLGKKNPYFKTSIFLDNRSTKIKVLAPEKQHSKQFTSPII
jgi:hypothetical protein